MDLRGGSSCAFVSYIKRDRKSSVAGGYPTGGHGSFGRRYIRYGARCGAQPPIMRNWRTLLSTADVSHGGSQDKRHLLFKQLGDSLVLSASQIRLVADVEGSRQRLGHSWRPARLRRAGLTRQSQQDQLGIRREDVHPGMRQRESRSPEDAAAIGPSAKMLRSAREDGDAQQIQKFVEIGSKPNVLRHCDSTSLFSALGVRRRGATPKFTLPSEEAVHTWSGFCTPGRVFVAKACSSFRKSVSHFRNRHVLAHEGSYCIDTRSIGWWRSSA